jgi:hypothetical protein
MKKRHCSLLIFLLYSCCFGNFAKAQIYNIESFQGLKTEINLYYKPFSGCLTISCLKDTLHIDDYMDAYEIKVLGKKFLQITYLKRAGSNENLMNMLLLCVDNGKLCQALHVKCLSTYDMRNVYHIKGNRSEYQLFKLKVKLLGNGKDTYRLNINIHDESSSEIAPKTNYNYNKQITLRFDPVLDVFYGTRKILSKSFNVYDPKTEDQIAQEVHGSVPTIIIRKNEYYYINGEWFQKGHNNNLLRLLFK